MMVSRVQHRTRKCRSDESMVDLRSAMSRILVAELGMSAGSPLLRSDTTVRGNAIRRGILWCIGGDPVGGSTTKAHAVLLRLRDACSHVVDELHLVDITAQDL